MEHFFPECEISDTSLFLLVITDVYTEEHTYLHIKSEKF